MAEPSPWLRWPRLSAGAVAAAAVAALVVYGPVGSYAGQLLTVFEPVKVAPVNVPTSGLFAGLGRLGDYGAVTAPNTDFAAAPSQRAAEAATGLTLSLPTALPGGLGRPSFAVLRQTTVAFTFLASKAEATAKAAGVTLPPMPASLDHSTLTVTLGPATIAVYPAPGGLTSGLTPPAALGLSGHQHSATAGVPSGSQGLNPPSVTQGDSSASELNSLYVAVMQAPVVRSSGANATTIENYLLSLPGIPSSLAAELRALEHPAQTLPLPIPEGEATATNITLGSQPAVAIADRSGMYNAIVWEAAGRIHAVAGPFTPAEIQAAARSVAAQG
jgi:hypothetical protein